MVAQAARGGANGHLAGGAQAYSQRARIGVGELYRACVGQPLACRKGSRVPGECSDTRWGQSHSDTRKGSTVHSAQGTRRILISAVASTG